MNEYVKGVLASTQPHLTELLAAAVEDAMAVDAAVAAGTDASGAPIEAKRCGRACCVTVVQCVKIGLY